MNNDILNKILNKLSKINERIDYIEEHMYSDKKCCEYESQNCSTSPIEYIMDNFDFEKVHKVMEFLDWKWSCKSGSYVPTIENIKAEAKHLMEESIELKSDIATGGFHVFYERDNDTGKIYLKLVFELTDWDNFD